ncbi:MAG: DUF3619 family protein [Gallionella sp.]|nr:DUF3619 family protein [Gallionella sp.]
MKPYKQDLNHTRIAELLTQSSGQLDEHIVTTLRQARAIALQKQKLREPVLSLSAIGHRAHALMPHSTHQWLATAMLLAAIVVSVTSYCQYTQEHQGSHLDIAILTGDLPIEVFIDH